MKYKFSVSPLFKGVKQRKKNYCNIYHHVFKEVSFRYTEATKAHTLLAQMLGMAMGGKRLYGQAS